MPHSDISTASDGELDFCSRAAIVSRVRVTEKFDLLGVLDHQDVLEALANRGEYTLGVFLRSSLLRGAFARACGSRPQADAVKALANVDDDAHDFIVLVVLELLANGGKQCVQPDLIVRLWFLESVCPSSAVLVLLVFPFWSHAGLENVIIGFCSQLASRSDVVLCCDQ